MKKTRLFVFAMMLGFGLIFTSCNDSSSGPENVHLTGTVATGTPMGDGVVWVTNSNGEEFGPVDVNTDGSFAIDAAKGAPYILKANSSSSGITLYSYANAAGIANITSLTNLALFIAGDANTDPATIYSGWANSQFTLAQITEAAQKVNANLAAIYNDHSVDPNTYDFFSSAFTADGTGIDAVMDDATITLDAAGATIDAAISISSQDGNILFDMNVNISGISFENGGDTNGSGNGVIPQDSTWSLTINVTTNGVSNSSTTTVMGSEVPAQKNDFNAMAIDKVTGSYSGNGMTVDYKMNSVTYEAHVDGVVGDTVKGTASGTVTVSGTVNGITVPSTTTNFAYEYNFVRTQ